MASSISPDDPTRTQWQPALEPPPLTPGPTPGAQRQRGRRSLFWPGFAVGFLLLASLVCGGLGATFGLTRISLADIQNEGAVWTPPPVTVAASVPVAAPAPVIGASTLFAAGDVVRNVTSSRVNIRTTPGYLGKPADDVLGLVGPNEQMTVLGDSQSADNLIWWRIRYAGADGRQLDGWVAEATASGVQILAR